jgi:hypothetical protein
VLKREAAQEQIILSSTFNVWMEDRAGVAHTGIKSRASRTE